MSKTIDLSHFTEDHLSAVINILQYIKSHPGHLDKIIEVLDDGIVELQGVDGFTLGPLTLKGAEAVLELKHYHDLSCWTYKQPEGKALACEASNMTKARKV